MNILSLNLSKAVLISSFLSVLPILSLLTFPKSDKPFWGVFYGNVSLLGEVDYRLIWALVFFIFIVRGPHAIYTWWIVYFDSEFKATFSKKEYRKLFIIFPLVALPMLLALTFFIVESFGYQGKVIVAFFTLSGPAYSYHIMSQDYGILALLQDKGGANIGEKIELKNKFKYIKIMDIIFYSAPFFIIFNTLNKTSEKILYGLLWLIGILSTLLMLQIMYIGRSHRSRSRNDYKAYCISILVEFFSRLLMLASIGVHFWFYLLRVIRHTVLCTLLVQIYTRPTNNNTYKGAIEKNIKKSVSFFYLISILCGFFFSFMYCILLLPTDTLGALVGLTRVNKEIWGQIQSLAIASVGSFSLSHYYFDSFPWKINKPERKKILWGKLN
jgi:hypothetical protein